MSQNTGCAISEMLFGKNSPPKSLMTKLCFGPFNLSLAKIITSKGIKKSVILSTDGEFLRSGRRIKEFLIKSNLTCEAITLDSQLMTVENFTSLCSFSPDAIIVLGDEVAVNLARYVSLLNNCICIIAPVNPICSHILNEKVSVLIGGKWTEFICKQPDYALIDRDIYISPKKQYLAEAYGDVISKSISLIDYKCAVLLGKTSFNKDAYELIRSAVGFALNIKSFKEPSEGLILAQLKLAIAYSLSPQLSRGGEWQTAKLLQATSDSPKGECQLQAFYKLVYLYRFYLECNVEGLNLLPDPVMAVQTLSEFTKRPEHEVVGSIKSCDFQTISRIKAIKKLVKANFLKELDGLILVMERIKDNYYYLYGGKKKLSNFTPEQLKKAIKCSSYLSDATLLSMLCAQGLSEFII